MLGTALSVIIKTQEGTSLVGLSAVSVPVAKAKRGDRLIVHDSVMLAKGRHRTVLIGNTFWDYLVCLSAASILSTSLS